ncbi:UbiX family flavin prenyltransferase [Dehalobacter restrictus]|uniref:Flavin prenyltransferase UbiX n=1 Tax=Dehalobacter restrictus TaxID=55583 RepID=A0A857DI66_9FIRM|nr:UbiX family flavin prenyltransferase [Dehalobacter restrictus]QHA00984.1 UbiX family flavin prenyltransferase [Dehalobacter restrictus]
MKILVAMTGATGVIYGVRLLEVLKETEHHVSLIMSGWVKETLSLETDYAVGYVQSLADKVYDHNDLAAAVASGSYGIEATIVAPCSMKTLSGIANGYSDNLIVRASDVALKERRPLLLMIRETPLSSIHLKNMTTVTEAGGILVPPVPAFYHRPKTIDDIVNQSVGKALDLLKVPHNLYERWRSDQ